MDEEKLQKIEAQIAENMSISTEVISGRVKSRFCCQKRRRKAPKPGEAHF
jgi:hypothetical protein